MLMSELATLVKYALPVKMIVLKNNLLGMIKWEQLAFEGNPQFGVELQPIDFAACARSCGATGFSVDDPAQLHDVYRQAFAHPGPVVVEAVIDPMEAPLPGKITMEQAWQFAKAVARGQEDRWDLLKTLMANKIREVV